MLDDDENLVIWNPGQPAERGSPAGHRGNVNDVALDRSGELLASVSSIESKVKLHDFRTGETRDPTVPTDAPLIAVSLTVDKSGTRVAVGDQQEASFLSTSTPKGLSSSRAAWDPLRLKRRSDSRPTARGWRPRRPGRSAGVPEREGLSRS